MRGSITAWEILNETPSQISNDTLYFIYEDADNSTEGKLYLGQKLISGVSSGGSSNINIADLGDIYIDDETLADKQILVYNETNEQWENTSLSTIINTAVGVMQGASENEDGAAGLVPVPSAGSQAKFLRGDATWATIDIPTFNTDIFSLDSNSNITLQGYNLASVGSVPVKTNAGIQWVQNTVGQLNLQIVTWDELVAIAEDFSGTNNGIIYLVSSNDPSSNDEYEEYMVINGAIERLGTLGQVNLNQYVTTTVFNTEVNKLESTLYDQIDENTGETTYGLVSRVVAIENNYITKSEIGDLSQLLLSEGNSTLVEEVNTINDRLKWHDLVQ